MLWLVGSSGLRDAKLLARSQGLSVMFMARFCPSLPSSFRLLFQLLADGQFRHHAEVWNACQLVVLGKGKPDSSLGKPLAPVWKFQFPSHHHLPVIVYVEDSGAGSELEPFWLRAVVDFMDFKSRLLTFLSAYTSTLGGGYFLCKHVNVAWRLALRQEKIALALEDYTSAGQCRVHLTYILMQMGRLDEAKQRLRRERHYARRLLMSERLAAIVRAAKMYLDKLSLKQDELRKPAPHPHHHHSLEDGSFVIDNYRRQRFVI
ncbi:hypothetical protein BASA81_003863 [Batrachochytrium salamandrivorans]|nr:hypothetical protein BASA81_003863 [Batrachochytrium salamandrivorans]